MDLDLRIDAATTSFTTCADRFVKGGYKPSLPFPRQLELLASVPGIKGVALDYPSQYDDPAALRYGGLAEIAGRKFDEVLHPRRPGVQP